MYVRTRRAAFGSLQRRLARDGLHLRLRCRRRNRGTDFRRHLRPSPPRPALQISECHARLRALPRLAAVSSIPAISARELECVIELSACSVPSDGLFVQIDVHLLRLQIFFNAPRTQLAAESGLLVPAPRRLDVRRLHVIHPNNSRSQSLYHSEGLENVP